ncbi:hypothetical protein [Caulobacter sp. S45]|uniref:hypothetical protein n=1 Tax=Caulobacter sp. S45 TaxID=1641861 RepID=UPI00131EBF5E|nr:hypothetical protein [Caulobacter sp. S45]
MIIPVLRNVDVALAKLGAVGPVWAAAGAGPGGATTDADHPPASIMMVTAEIGLRKIIVFPICLPPPGPACSKRGKGTHHAVSMRKFGVTLP